MSPNNSKNVMTLNVKPLETLVFGVYIVFILLGTMFLFMGIQMITMPQRQITINSYALALLSLGFAFMIALLCYHKYRVNLTFTIKQKLWG